MPTAHSDSKTRLLDAALTLVRRKGYTATRIEDVCAEAGVTKGSFFHHFKSKDDLIHAAVARWDDVTGARFAQASYHDRPDPLDRVLGYLEFRKALLVGAPADFTCFAGTIVQEAHQTRPELVAACEHNISGHARTLEGDIAGAMRRYRVQGDWGAADLALHIQAVLQGGFILAKAKGGAAVAASSIDHLARYLELLFRGRADHSPS